MGYGSDNIGMFKINTKIFWKDTIENLTKYWPGGYYLMLNRNSTVTGYIPLIIIVYKYDYLRVLYLISTEDTGIKKSYIPYLSNSLYQFANVAICPVDCPLVISELFGYVNEVDSHNKYRHYDLSL